VCIIGVVNLVAGLASTGLIGKVGRKTMLLGGSIVCGVFLIACGIFSQGGNQSLQTFGIFAYIVAFGCTLGPVVWLYIPEIVPDVGIGLTTLVNWLTSFAIVQAFGLTIGLGINYNLYGFAIFCFLGALFVLACVKETRNKTEAQITAEFEGKQIDSDSIQNA